MYFACIKFANKKELVALKIYTNPLITKKLDMKNRLSSCFKNQRDCQFISATRATPAKKPPFLGEVFYFLDLS